MELITRTIVVTEVISNCKRNLQSVNYWVAYGQTQSRSAFCLFVCFLFTGLPYTAIPVGKWVEFLRFIFFRVGKSLACHSPGKWCLCA